MVSSSRVETIFFEALEKKAGAERADYLDQACGGDAALRLQVERLLDAHPQAKAFLAQPAVDRQKFNSHHEADEWTSPAPTSGPETSPRDPKAGADTVEALDHETGDDAESALSSKEKGDNHLCDVNEKGDSERKERKGGQSSL